LATSDDPAVIFALKKYSNSFVITGVKWLINNGKLSLDDVRALYPEAYPHALMIVFFKVFSILPWWMQKISASVLKWFKSR
jgi:hypothetical protein